jgi:amino acid transporter
MPVAASEAAYVEEAFRRKRLALAVGLLSIATSTVSAATIAVGASGYVGVFLPLPQPVLIAAIVLALGALATRSTLQAVSVAGAMTLIEVGGLAVIIVAGLAMLDLGWPCSILALPWPRWFPSLTTGWHGRASPPRHCWLSSPSSASSISSTSLRR